MFCDAANICLSAVNWAGREAVRSKGGSNTRKILHVRRRKRSRAIAEVAVHI